MVCQTGNIMLPLIYYSSIVYILCVFFINLFLTILLAFFMSISGYIPSAAEMITLSEFQCLPLVGYTVFNLTIKSIIMANLCLFCQKKVLSHAKFVTCAICSKKCHCKCISIKPNEIPLLMSSNEWYCFNCTCEALPFIHIDDDIEYIEALSTKDHFELYWDTMYEKCFNPFTLSH